MVRKIFCNNTPRFSKKELTILLYIASCKDYELITQTAFSQELNMPVTTANYHFTKLRGKGLIDDTNRLTNKGIKLLQYFKRWDKTFNKKLRAHNIQVVIHLAKCPAGFWENRNKLFVPFTNKRYGGLKTQILNCNVMFYSNKKAVAVIPDVYGNTDDEIIASINCFIPQLIQAMELEYEIKVAKYWVAKIKSMHVAVLNSIIAEKFMLKTGRCYSNGRIAIDNSHGVPELEAEDANTALEDIEVLCKYEDLARENELLKKELKDIESQLDNFRNTNHNQSNHNKLVQNEQGAKRGS